MMRLLSRFFDRTSRPRKSCGPYLPSRPRLEPLEDRLVPAFALGAAANYAILFEGHGSNHTLGIANSTTNTPGSGIAQGGGIGNVGVGGAGRVSVTGGGSAVNGNIDFSAANTG